MLRAAALCAALFVSAAYAQTPPRIAPFLTIGSPSCTTDFEEHTGEAFRVCGFRSAAVNADGTRFLTIDIAGQIRIVDSTGRELTRLNTNDAPAYHTTALFVGDTAVTLIGNVLRTFRAEDGRTLASQTFPPQQYPPDFVGVSPEGDILLQTRSWEARTGVRHAIYVIDTSTGQVINTRSNTSAILYGPARAWVVGRTLEREGETTRYFVVLKDRNLSTIETPNYCEPFGPTPRCVMFNYITRSGAVIDLASGAIAPFDLSALVESTTLVEWHAVSERDIAVVRTGIRENPTGVPTSLFSVIDLDGPRLLSSFEASSHRIAVGANAHGESELRLLSTRREYTEPFSVRRIDVTTGSQTIVGEAPQLIDAAALAPNGEILLPTEEGWTQSIASDSSRVVFEFPSRNCNQHLLWNSMDSCSQSADGSTLVVVDQGVVSAFHNSRSPRH